MSRPVINTRKSGGKRTSNPLVNWLERRREEREQAQEKASRMITNKMAENETIIVDQLNSIDFMHSRLPKSVLDHKTNPNQPCGDLEYAARGIVQMLLKNPQTIKMDIRKFDEKLLTLALLFKQTVEQGDVRAAYAAKAALIRGLNDIRTRIPQNQPELASQFVELNTKYMDEWITLVGISQVADRTKQNVQEQRLSYNKAKDKNDQEIKALSQMLESDYERAIAFKEIMDHDSPEERAKWTDVQKDVHRMMIDRRMTGAQLQLNNLLIQQQEMQLSSKEAQVEILHSKVAALPIVADPNLMNKFQEEIDLLFDELAASDAEIDETLKAMDDIEGRIAQLDSTPGAIRAREVATEEAEAVVEEIKRRQQIEMAASAGKQRNLMNELGIASEEELKEQIRLAEEAQQKLMEELNEQIAAENQDEESQVLYN